MSESTALSVLPLTLPSTDTWQEDDPPSAPTSPATLRTALSLIIIPAALAVAWPIQTGVTVVVMAVHTGLGIGAGYAWDRLVHAINPAAKSISYSWFSRKNEDLAEPIELEQTTTRSDCKEKGALIGGCMGMLLMASHFLGFTAPLIHRFQQNKDTASQETSAPAVIRGDKDAQPEWSWHDKAAQPATAAPTYGAK